MTKISAIILTKNSEKLIPDCLTSVSWTDEIVVIDENSSDKTREIAGKAGGKVFTFSGNFSEKRNFGAKKASGDWLLYVDVDERVTPLLRKEIRSRLAKREAPSSAYHQSPYVAYAIPRRNFVFGKELKYCGFWPDYVKRLFKKDKFRGWTGELHEEPNFEVDSEVVTGGKGKIGHLERPLTHLKHNNLSEMVAKTNEWSEIEARLMYEAKHPPMNLFRFSTAMFREFWLRMIKQKAFLDGTVGIIYAVYQVYSRFISYAKLWEMQLKAKK